VEALPGCGSPRTSVPPARGLPVEEPRPVAHFFRFPRRSSPGHWLVGRFPPRPTAVNDVQRSRWQDEVCRLPRGLRPTRRPRAVRQFATSTLDRTTSGQFAPEVPGSKSFSLLVRSTCSSSRAARSPSRPHGSLEQAGVYGPVVGEASAPRTRPPGPRSPRAPPHHGPGSLRPRARQPALKHLLETIACCRQRLAVLRRVSNFFEYMWLVEEAAA
jgi:hypothetical protein